MKKGLLQIYTGEGKGKTTAALGCALRAWGQGYKVCIFQFLKNTLSGEAKAAKKLGSGFRIVSFRQTHPCFLKKKRREGEKKLALSLKRALARVEKTIKDEKYDVIVLDEIINAVEGGFLDERKLQEVLSRKPAKVEIILTGRGSLRRIRKGADYISRIKEEKHPYRRGIKARRGIEY